VRLLYHTPSPKQTIVCGKSLCSDVSGALIARELSRYDLKIALLEKHNDVATETSKASSAIVHAGYDAREGKA